MKLQAGERVLGAFREHIVALSVRLLGFAGLIILPCFFIFPLFRMGVGGMAVFALPVLVGVVAAWRAVRLWDSTVFILTNRRLVHVLQRGIWDRHVSEVALAHVGDVQWEKRGLWQALWRIGTVRIRTNGGSVPSIVMGHLRAPERLAQSIQELRGQQGQKIAPLHPGAATPVEAQRERLIHQIQQANEEELVRLEEAMHEPM